jgi:hypothetical protein
VTTFFKFYDAYNHFHFALMVIVTIFPIGHNINYEDQAGVNRMVQAGTARCLFKNFIRRVSLMCGLNLGSININIIWVIILLILVFGNGGLGGSCSESCSVC